jgi:hypothetical protein
MPQPIYEIGTGQKKDFGMANILKTHGKFNLSNEITRLINLVQEHQA